MKRISFAIVMILMTFSLLATSVFAAVPDFQTLGFPNVVAEKIIDPGKADSITYGDVKIDIPEGTFKNKVKFQVLEGPLADFQKNTPDGETSLMNFAFKVTDLSTNELVGMFEKAVMFSYTNDKVNANSKYYDTLEDGTFSLNKVPAKIEGTTLSHPIKGAPVGWAVTSPTEVKNPPSTVPDFQKLGFPNVVAEKTIEPNKATSIEYGDVKIDIPEGTFKNTVKFQVLEGPLADFQKNTPDGETSLMNFAFKVTDLSTNELVGKFEKAVMFNYTNDKVNANSKYYDTTVDGTFSLNKVPAKIEGTTLSHPIKGAPVGWAVTSPAEVKNPPATVPDFQKLGFPNVVAEKTIEPNKATSIEYGNVKIDIPEGTFKNTVKFQVLEGPLADFQKNAPNGETALMNFAFKVTDLTTNELVGKFEKAVMFSYTDDKINANSKYYDTLVDGTFSLNKVPAKIEGTTLSHPIKGAPVGWAVTSLNTPVKNATSPVTGMNVIPWVLGGTALLLAGISLPLLARRRMN
ncbi:hypothetical protein [Cytobacillus dafuensis]|uniref:Isopeptide-forming domain-containing fimbrial protein n=1 Tax=Cytobacillus dafuensis TaxID=1742359 RepID=A0A5B8Z0X4_CYTDA|nr:hypothetical protein [Cytobacillus dafuensis]QED46600.1 hypothetical protein FSZ17_04525 [Cytobacillus dafuensis]